jgi:DNA processing protein
MYDHLNSQGISYVTYTDEAFPNALASAQNIPAVILFQGNLGVLDYEHIRLGSVGSRNIATQTKSVITSIIKELKDYEIQIVSGLAVGVDAFSHQEAIKNGLTAVGILGSPIDDEHYYPKQTVALKHHIIESGGLVLSEYAHTHKTMPHNFVLRNRIIAALSDATIVFQASQKSGSCSTGMYTLELDKMCWAVGGLPGDPAFSGGRDLIQKGAQPLWDYHQIFEHLELENKPQVQEKNVSDTASRILSVLSFEPVSIEYIQEKTGLSFVEISTAIMKLELTNGVRSAGSNQWILGS